MTRFAVLRPEPGNAATCRRLADAGLAPLALPLFELRALPWAPPDVADYDGLLLTSANAVRFAGPGLAALAALPVIAVGAATARAARAAGLGVAHVGSDDVAAALAGAGDHGRLLHLAGRDRIAAVPDAVAVYAADPLPVAPDLVASLAGQVALLHSPRAARRLRDIVPAGLRESIALVALSSAVAAAAADSWRALGIAERPDDPAMIAAATAIDR